MDWLSQLRNKMLLYDDLFCLVTLPICQQAARKLTVQFEPLDV